MSWVAVAVAGGAIVGGALQANAAKKAAAGQTQASQAAIDEQRRQFDVARSDLAPYREAGGAAVMRLRDLLGISAPATAASPRRSMEDIVTELRNSGRYTIHPNKQYDNEAQAILDLAGVTPGAQPAYDEWALNSEARRMYEAQPPEQAAAAGTQGMSPEEIMRMDPGYQFRLNEGNKAITNLASAGGRLNSGATLKALTRFGQDYASNEYGNIYNRLAGLAGTGQNATTTSAGLGANFAGNVGGLMTGAANARGAAGIGAANAYGGALNTIGNYYSQQATLDKLLANNGGSYSYGGFNSTPNYGYTP